MCIIHLVGCICMKESDRFVALFRKIRLFGWTHRLALFFRTFASECWRHVCCQPVGILNSLQHFAAISKLYWCRYVIMKHKLLWSGTLTDRMTYECSSAVSWRGFHLRFRPVSLSFISMSTETESRCSACLWPMYFPLWKPIRVRCMSTSSNLFDCICRVYIQAGSNYREHPDDINLFFVKFSSGGMVPLTALGTNNIRPVRAA